MHIFLNRLVALLRFVIMGILIMLALLTFLQVISRFVLKLPIVWTGEIIRIGFAWMIALGIAVGVKEGSHLGIDIISPALSERGRLVLRLGIDLLIGCALVFMFVASIAFFTKNIDKVTITLKNLPANTIYSATVIGGICALLFGAEVLAGDVKALAQRKAAGAEEGGNTGKSTPPPRRKAAGAEKDGRR